MMKSLVFFIFAFTLTTSLYAKRFTSQYAEFELPPGWECQLEGSEWVCQSTNADRMKEAIIIMAAKIRGTQDSLDGYQEYLKTKKSFDLPGGRKQISEPKVVEVKEYNSHRWVDALHMASEVPGFYTRYLATVKEDLGVAVTFSVSKDHYTLYQPVFDKIVASLRVFRQNSGFNPNMALKKSDENLLGDSAVIPDVDETFALNQKKKEGKKGGGGGDSMLYLLLLGAGAIGFVIYKKKKNK
jgi:hypothetical protein